MDAWLFHIDRVRPQPAPRAVLGHAAALCTMLWSLLTVVSSVSALDIPPLQGPVDDRADLLPEGAERMLRDDLLALEAKTGHQFALLTVESLEGLTLEQYGPRVVEASKLGRATGRDDGLLLLIVKEGSLIGMHVGRDLHEAIPQAIALGQIREDLYPAMQRGVLVEGVFTVFQRWMNAAGGLAGAVVAGSETPPALAPDSPEFKAAIAQKVSQRAIRAGAVTFQVPALKGPVNDYAALLSGPRRAQLEQELRDFRTKTGPQFALLTVPSLDGFSVEDYAMKVVETWQLGRAGVDDGLLLLVAKNDRKLRIEVGYGLEGTIPDVVAARVVRDTLEPAFKRGLFAEGIATAFRALMRAVDGQEHAPATRRVSTSARSASWGSQRRMDPTAANALLTLLLALVALISAISFARFWRGKGSFLGLHLDDHRRLRVVPTSSDTSDSSSSSDAYASNSSGSDSISSSARDSESGGGGRFGGGGASGSW